MVETFVTQSVFGGDALVIDDNYVEYWFDITVDDYIDNKTKYEYIVSRDFKGTIFDNKVGYQEFIQTPGDVLYTTENDEEEC